MYEIETGHPMPPAAAGPGGKKYPLAEMKVGESIIAKTDKERNRIMCAANGHSCTRAGQGKKFASRKVADVYRVWRIA